MTETQLQFAGSEDLNPNVATGVLLDDIAARIRIPPRIRWADGTIETDDCLRRRVLGAIQAALPPRAIAVPAKPQPRLSVTLDLATTQPDAETRRTLAAALCQVAIAVATGMREGVVDEADGVVVARFRIED
jgi:hypothetical protein